jgi:hypothetical protein
MKVARQFTAWDAYNEAPRPRRDGMIESVNGVAMSQGGQHKDHTVPTGRDTFS